MDTKAASTSYDAVQRCYRHIVQHASAFFCLLDHIITQNLPFSSNILLETHRILISGTEAENSNRRSSTSKGGVYRTEAIRYTPFLTLAPAGDITEIMSRVVLYLNAAILEAEEERIADPYQLAAKFSHTILGLHPFLDGNSRFSRILINTILLKFTGTLIPFGKDPAEVAKWKEVVTRIVMIKVQGDKHAGEKVAWAEMATFMLILGRREMKTLKSRLASDHAEGCGKVEQDAYPWKRSKDDYFVEDMKISMGYKNAVEKKSKEKRDEEDAAVREIRGRLGFLMHLRTHSEEEMDSRKDTDSGMDVDPKENSVATDNTDPEEDNGSEGEDNSSWLRAVVG